jgi:hypothetical protein
VEWAEWECNHSYSKQNSKRAVFTAVFLSVVKICSEVCSEGAVKFLRKLTLFKTSQKYYLRKLKTLINNNRED